ncbi:MAG: BON domain-containing protein [Pseudomonadota bacterium]
MAESRRLRAISRGIRPHLSQRADRAMRAAMGLHTRLLSALERKPGDLDDQQRLERNTIALASAGLLAMFCLWCSLRAVPVIERDVTAQVDRVLLRELANTWVQADVLGREVLLFGVAPSDLDQARIREAVGELAAVTRVHDHLVVAMAPGQLASARASRELNAGAAPGLPRSLSIVFDGSELRLVGEVGDAQTTTALVHDAERRFTAQAVSTELSLTPRTSTRWKQTAAAAVSTIALLDIANAELRRDRDGRASLTLTGVAADSTTLSAVRESLRQRVPAQLPIQVDLISIFRDGRADRSACNNALELVLDAGELLPDGDFTGLDRRSRLTLDQVRALVQSCGAGLVIAAPEVAPRGFATFADDLRAYLIEAGVDAQLVAVARVAGRRESVKLQLVFQPTEQEN